MNISAFDIHSKYLEISTGMVLHSIFGMLNTELIDRELDSIEDRLCSLIESRQVRKKVFHVCIEILQKGVDIFQISCAISPFLAGLE